jgi:type IV secretory pathway VirB2 component (pilin)
MRSCGNRPLGLGRILGYLLLFNGFFSLFSQESQVEDAFFHTTGQVFTESDWVTANWVANDRFSAPFWNTLGDYDGVAKRGNFTGTIESKPFRTSKTVTFFTGGDFHNSDIRIGVRKVSTGEEIRFFPLKRIEGVDLKRWKLPKGLRNTDIVLFARDNSPGQIQWVGISEPLQEIPSFYYFHNSLQIAHLVLNSLMPILVFLLIGIGGTKITLHFFPSARKGGLFLVYFCPLLLGYILFFIAVKSVFVASILGLLALAISVWSIVAFSSKPRIFGKDDWRWYGPFILLLVVSMVLTYAILETGWSDLNPVMLAQERLHMGRRPLDNYLPLLTIERLFSEEGLKPYIIGWKSTDRPPLQAGPFIIGRLFAIDSITAYQAFSTFLQCSVLLGIASFLRSIQLERKTAILIGISMIFSSTFIINSIFVRTKFFPLFFLFWVMGVLFKDKSPSQSVLNWWMIGSACACSLLVHPGSAYALLPIFLVYVAKHKKVVISQVFAAIIVFATLIYPWKQFQKQYDPPGNMLAKRFIADHSAFDDMSVLDAAKESYSQLTPKMWLEGRWENAKITFGGFERALGRFWRNVGAESLPFRDQSYDFVFVAAFPSILFLPFSFYCFFYQTKERKNITEMLLLILGIGLLAWNLILLPAGETYLSHGTLLFPILIQLIIVFPLVAKPLLLKLFLAFQTVFHSTVWIFPRVSPMGAPIDMSDIHIINPISILIILFSLIGLFLVYSFSCDSNRSIQPT